MYVRESEKHAVDHVLLERLQREVARLRTLVLKLRENQCEGPAGNGLENVANVEGFVSEGQVDDDLCGRSCLIHFCVYAVSGLIALYQDGRKLTVKDVVERNALLTEQLAKERAEVQTDRQNPQTTRLYFCPFSYDHASSYKNVCISACVGSPPSHCPVRLLSAFTRFLSPSAA